jgi:hypothetical protein
MKRAGVPVHRADAPGKGRYEDFVITTACVVEGFGSP